MTDKSETESKKSLTETDSVLSMDLKKIRKELKEPDEQVDVSAVMRDREVQIFLE